MVAVEADWPAAYRVNRYVRLRAGDSNPDEALSDYGVHAQAHMLAALVHQHQPTAVLLPATNDGRDVAARLSAILDCGILCNAARLYVHEGKIASEEGAFDGAMLISCVTTGEVPTIVTVRGKVFAAERTGGDATIEEVSYTPEPEAHSVRVLEVVRNESSEAVPTSWG